MCVRRSERRRQHGVSLIELIMFIVIIGAAVAGVLGAINYATRASTDPMIQKQALAIAEALMEEVQLQPFTYCDPDDPAAPTADSAAACATVESIGAEGGETRTGATLYDNVSDYNPLDLVGGITDINGNAIAGLNDYSAHVRVTGSALGGIGAGESLLIEVTVNHHTLPSGVVLHGYRTRYAPNALP
jgi:MSHA pilin protein MshD